jgi:hypothetical protein
MSHLRSLAPILILVAIMAVAGILFSKRMADFGEDIHTTAGRSA